MVRGEPRNLHGIEEFLKLTFLFLVRNAFYFLFYLFILKVSNVSPTCRTDHG